MRARTDFLGLTPRRAVGTFIVLTSVLFAGFYLAERVARTGGWSVERVAPSVHQDTTRGLRFDMHRVARGDTAFTVRAVSFDRNTSTARIIDLPAGLPGTLRDQLEAHRAQLIINGGFFDADFAPVGHVMIDGQPLSAYTSDPGIAGMVVIYRGDELRVMRSNAWTNGAPNLLQTGPILVTDNGGRVPLQKYVQSADRSGIAEDRDRVSVFTTTPVSIAGLADAMHHRPEAFGLDRITFALALDGGPSSGMAARIGDREYVQEPRGRIRNAIVIRAR